MLAEFPQKHGVPPAAALGGAETTYPEYRMKMGEPPVARARGASADPSPAWARGEIKIMPVQGRVYMLVGAGANVVVQVGEDGVTVVDAGLKEYSEKVLAAIRELSNNKPIRFILSTHAHADHVGGNETLARAGAKLGGGLFVGGVQGQGAAIIAHEQVLAAMSAPTGKQPPAPSAAWPTDGYPGDLKELYVNGEGIQLVHSPAAHTDGDSIVYFRGSDVIAAGDVYINTTYPVIDVDRGGSLSGIIAGLNRIIDLAIPKDWQEGGTMVVPGHGRLADESDIVEYRDMLTIIRDRIQDLVKKGLTLEQVKAARPTLDYDGRYGATSGDGTTEKFIDAAYRDLARAKPKSGS
jgi:glyoxylase-like metal-dependent hydrolase (beta-lactamase superfamily II)